MQCGKELDLPHGISGAKAPGSISFMTWMNPCPDEMRYALGKYYGQAERPISTG